MVRVLVVDDSAFMRASIATQLEKDPAIKVVGTARDGLDALQQAQKLDPDVITLDVEMPRLNGLETLKRIMRETPLPVLMVSSLTAEGAETTLKAMEYGAQDYILKAMTHKEDFGQEIRQKVKALALRKALLRLKYRQPLAPATATLPPRPAGTPLRGGIRPPSVRPAARPGAHADNYMETPCKGPRDLVVIGVSTGGPPVVQKILTELPADLPACILVAQHMPATFTGPFAKRLDKVSPLTVTEAQDGDKFLNGHVYVCPGGRHIGIRMRGPLPEISVSEEPRDALYKPTVNVLMETAGKGMGHRTLGVMLTGMGSDGCEGARVLREKGGCLIAQSEASCVVYGMPKAVVDAKLANVILDADDIPQAILKTVNG